MSTQGIVLNSIEHILKRPDNYIGSIETREQEVWYYNNESNTIEMGIKTVNLGLKQIICEGISNAIDNKWRSDENGYKMTYIDVTMDQSNGRITIENDGYPIPIKKQNYEYKDERTKDVHILQLYPAELYFGYVRSGTNYNDDEQRKTSGRNGIGAKAMNIYSKEFIVEHTDPNNKKKFKQVYTNNSSDISPPEITSYKSKAAYTRISFIPDYDYFNYPESNSSDIRLDDNLMSIIKKSICDAALITGCKVTLNDIPIVIPSLDKYVNLFSGVNNRMSFKTDNGDEAVLVENYNDNSNEVDNVRFISFVNGLSPKDGGTHVNVWRDKLFSSIVRAYNEKCTKKKVGYKVKAKQLYPHFILFIRCELYNPKFTDQMKSYLDMDKNLISYKTPDDKELGKILKWTVFTKIDEYLEMTQNKKQDKDDNKKSSRLVSMGDKGQHANWAGTNRSLECQLMLVEGHSAKTMALNAIACLEDGYNKYGVFALKGKFINATNATKKSMDKNDEAKLLKSILNLSVSSDYNKDEEMQSLNYGGVIILTDADNDGLHIRGLVMAWLYHDYPSLFNKGFVRCLSTPIATFLKGKTQTFTFSYAEYEDYIRDNKITSDNADNKVRYNKGLGTIPNKAIPLIFAQDKLKYVNIFIEGNEEEFMKLGFDKKASDMKKTWITKDTSVGHYAYEGDMSLSSFVDGPLRNYHIVNMLRSIPCIYDGFRDAKRMVWFVASQLKSSILVSQLQGKILEKTNYHYGAQSLEGAIVHMAQGFVGSNNIPLLLNDGQYGSRREGGDDAAAGRYLNTKPENISYSIFRSEDLPIYEYNQNDYLDNVEPKYYMPIVPMCLINGVNSIGSGYSTTIPAYNPTDIITWIRMWLDDENSVNDLGRLKPWYRNFKGEIETVCKGDIPVKWISTGVMDELDKGWWQITETPIGLWSDKLKEILEGMQESRDKKGKTTKFISKIECHSTADTINFKFLCTKNFIPDMVSKGNLKCLKSSEHLTNMVLLDENGYPHKYETVEEILHKFCTHRLTFYEKRKDYILNQLNRQLEIIRNKYHFVKYVAIDKSIDLYKDNVNERLEELGLVKMDDSYDYLVDMPIKSMTKEKVDKFKIEMKKIKDNIENTENTSAKMMWMNELDELEKVWNKFKTDSVLRDDVENIKPKKKRNNKNE